VIQCPLCGSMSFKVETGRELNIVEMEVDQLNDKGGLTA